MTDDPRFSSLGRLLGHDALARLDAAHVAVIGVGGVGSWAAEALARSGVGRITLVDMDDVCVTNINRQIHALSSTVGHAKTEALAKRIADIHPGCLVDPIYEFLTSSNARELIHPGFDYVFDATDRMSVKAAILQRAVEVSIPVITAGSAGGKIDPGRVRCVDFGLVGRDDFLKLVRRNLRRENGWAGGEGNF